MPPADSNSIAGFLGWLGRQVGHISRAVNADVTQASPEVDGEPSQTPAAAVPSTQVLYHDRRVEERPHPDHPGVTLRRTVVDEVIARPVPGPASVPPSAADEGKRDQPSG